MASNSCVHRYWAASWENLFMLYEDNKGAAQPAHPPSLINTFVVHCLDSIISLVSTSNFKLLASLCSWVGRFEPFLIKNPKDRSVMWLISARLLFLFLQELEQIHKPETLLDQLIMEKKLYEIALKEWNSMEQIGTSFSPQMQKDVSHFFCIYAFNFINNKFSFSYKCSQFSFGKQTSIVV